MLRGDLLDVHAALGARHQRRRAAVARSTTIADVELLLDVGAFLDEQPAHLLPLRPGLVRDELHAEDLAGERRAPRRATCATLTPPPLPRPPAWICAFTTHTGAAERLRRP